MSSLSTEYLKIKDHCFPRISALFGLLTIVTVLVSLNPGMLSTDQLSEDASWLGVRGFGLGCLTIWLMLKVARRHWIIRRPLLLEVRRGFSRTFKPYPLPAVCTLRRDGRRIHFFDPHAVPGSTSPAVTFCFATQRAAILTENRLMAFLDPYRIQPFIEGPDLMDRARMAPATYGLIAMNMIFSINAWSHGDEFVMSGALSNAGMQAGEYYRLLTSIFLHYNGLHLMMNMLALASLGFQVERIVGSRRMLLIYFAAGLGGGFWALQFIGKISLLGASGAVFGLFGAIAYFIYLGRNRLPPTVFLPSSRQLTIDLMINASLSLLPFISFAAHFGGFVAGFVLSALLMMLWPMRRSQVAPERVAK